MADDEPSILNQVRNLVWGPPKQKYRHACFVWHSLDPTEWTSVCMIASNGALNGRTVRGGWTTLVRPLETPRLVVSADDMDMYEFQDVLAKAGGDVVEGRVSGVGKVDLAVQRLSAWRPPLRKAGHEAQAFEIYVMEVENEYEDSLFHPDDIGTSPCSVL